MKRTIGAIFVPKHNKNYCCFVSAGCVSRQLYANSVRGDDSDAFSAYFCCTKESAIKRFSKAFVLFCANMQHYEFIMNP